MNKFQIIGQMLMVFIVFTSQSCATELTTEQKQTVASLKEDLNRIRQEIEQATSVDSQYSGGLIKTLIRMRLEVLKTNEALVEQRIHAIESGARIKLVVIATEPDPTRAAILAKEIETQREKVEEARIEADRYSGGLVHAMAETAVATSRNTLAMLEQQFFIAKYGLGYPTNSDHSKQSPPAESISQLVQGPASSVKNTPADCLEIDSFDSSVLSRNDVFMELAWKADIRNICQEPFQVRVRFVIQDENEFELDDDTETIFVPANDIGKARGKMLVSPIEKAARMAKHGVSVQIIR